MFALLVTAVLAGEPMTEFTTGDAIEAQLKKNSSGPAAVIGTLERISLRKGLGTALVTDDGKAVWISYGAPPTGWEPLLGKRSASPESLMAPHLNEPRLPVEVPREVLKLVGKKVRLVGIAENAKGGAVVLVGKSPVYIAGKDSWPEAMRTKRVSLGGTLVNEQYLPVATVSPKGEISQGTSGGTQTVLRDATEATTF
jgi:hypothetical protein